MGVKVRKNIIVGCCGFPTSRKKYYNIFETVELQQTFYELPSPQLAKRWREESPNNFIFHVKAWQVITHPPTSPTWRRMKKKPPGVQENYGFLQYTQENKEAWKAVLEIASILKAHLIILQTPASMKYVNNIVKNVERFFEYIANNRGDHVVGWEPRGNIAEHIEDIREVFCTYDIIHVVDPFKRNPIVCEDQELIYFRLHGIGKGEVNYRYKYKDEDLIKLLEIVRTYIEKGISRVYVLFNNVYMLDDAKRFKELVEKHLE